MSIKKRNVCFIITSKIHYARSVLLLKELKKQRDVELQIVLGGSAILPDYGDVPELMARDGIAYDERIVMTLAGGTTTAMAKTTGLGIMEFTTTFDNLQPDVVVVRGDRYEILSVVIAAAYLNIPVAHIEGGDVSGTIDESVRHAVTKLSHIHFPTNKKSAQRIVRMGEDPKYVFTYGATEVEYVARSHFKASNKLINYLGVGDAVDIRKPYVIVMQHPVTSEVGKNRQHTEATLHAVHELGIPAIWFWPNVDAGTDEVSKAIRTFREEQCPKRMRFVKHVPPEQFLGLLKRSQCLIGNSSAGIKECSYLGVPVVNIGSRQQGRMRAKNVADTPYKKTTIRRAIEKQLSHGAYPKSTIYYQKDTSKKIAHKLATVELYSQKRFID